MTLPAPPAEPLHVLPPWSPPPLLLLLALFLVFGLLYLWLRHRLARRTPAATPAGAARETATPIDAGSELDRLKREYLALEAYREGCHALARLVRRKLEAATGLEVEEMTSVEIDRVFSTAARGERRRAGALMRRLADLQFRRREPRRQDFTAACDQAGEVLAAPPARGAPR